MGSHGEPCGAMGSHVEPCGAMGNHGEPLGVMGSHDNSKEVREKLIRFLGCALPLYTGVFVLHLGISGKI